MVKDLTADNAHVDALAGLGSAFNHKLKRSILEEYLDKPSIEVKLAAEVSQWSIDLVGLMPPATGGKGMMIVAIDYFTKWQFGGKDMAKFFQKYGIKQYISTLRYPQDNRRAEASNKMILDCLKKSLTNKKGKWPDKLPGCLWAYRTTKDEQPNNKKMVTSLDLAEEKCKWTITHIVAYQQQLFSNYNKRAKIRQFQPEYLVLR
ncbi:uncharacterized protein [Pyrus communis]|uniref:uncharacterized protein n=1 Tax=Pyrus communis TaxID=23211 RepID=UPI0035C11B83